MSDTSDPFRHHPGLRGKVKPPEQSFFRDFHPDRLRVLLAERGLPTEVILPDATIEASRRRFLDAHGPGDLWVFGYGSLIWDPAVHFTEIRRARAPGHERRFILKDTLGGRGDAENPGLIAALDAGTGCDGVAFRIHADLVEEETRRLWFREQVIPAYHARAIPLDTAHGPVTALAFLADHEADLIDAGLSFEDQVRYCATGRGFMGTSLEYVENLCAHFEELKIHDPALLALAEAARQEAARFA